MHISCSPGAARCGDLIALKAENRGSCRKVLYGTVVWLSLISHACFAQSTRSVVLAWDPNPAGDLAGYRLYYGEQTRSYSNVTNLPAVTEARIPGLLVGTTYYFAVTAQNRDGLESDFSNEVMFQVPARNSPPTISGLTDQVVEQDSSISIPFQVGDAETPASELTLIASAANSEILPLSGIVFSGNGEERTVTIRPAPGYVGPVGVTIRVRDPQGAEAFGAFTLVVAPLNRPPTIDPIPNKLLLEDSGLQAVLLTGISAGGPGESQPVSMYVESSNPNLIPRPAAVYSSPNNSGYLFLMPKANAYGTCLITLVLDDGQLLNNWVIRVFSVTVLPINDPPTLGPLGNISMPVNSGPVPIVLFGISAGPNESQQLNVMALSSDPNVVPHPYVSYLPGMASGLLTVTPAPDAVGNASVTVRVTEVATGVSFSRTFNVNILDVPELLPSVPDEVTLAAGANAAVPFTAYEPGAEPSSLVLRASSLDAQLIPPDQISIYGQGAQRQLVIVPANGQAGMALVALTAKCVSGSITKYIKVCVAPEMIALYRPEDEGGDE